MAVAVCFWLLVHRTTIGRALFAIGFSGEGARYAGIPVERRIGLVYVVCGVVASLAAVIYVAHLGQAKADAGTGYELLAITAVVLGGTSIFGGRGSILGTLLGLFAIAILQNGLRLSDLPSELAGILTGGLLLVALSLDRLQSRATSLLSRHPNSAHLIDADSEGLNMKNSQMAVLCGVILLAAAMIAASNWVLVRSILAGGQAAAGVPAVAGAPGPKSGKPITVAMMPKSKGNA